MTDSCTVLYNGACPICSREVALYRTEAARTAAGIAFRDVTAAEAAGDLAALGLTPEGAARRFHVVMDGQLIDGIDAFVALWSALPRWRWLSRTVGSRAIRPVAALAYDHIAAPALYALHRRRQRRKALASARPAA
jgi:predicted DCC family thiol-disulfide oxidoreductase YuxK